jgi:hypothetical protein
VLARHNLASPELALLRTGDRALAFRNKEPPAELKLSTIGVTIMTQTNERAPRYPDTSYVRMPGPIFGSMDIVAAIVAAIMILGPLCAPAFVVNH